MTRQNANARMATLALLAACFCAPAMAQVITHDGSTIVIGQQRDSPAGKFNPADACFMPLPPVSTADQMAISNYQAKRQKFQDCVAHDPNADQQNLDRSLAAIGDDETDALGSIQQDNRGALNRAIAQGRVR